MRRSQFIVLLDNQTVHEKLVVEGVGAVKSIVGAVKSASVGSYFSLGCFCSHGTLVSLGRFVFKDIYALQKFVTLVTRCSPKCAACLFNT